MRKTGFKLHQPTQQWEEAQDVPAALPASGIAWNWTGALTRGTFWREPRTVEARQPMAVRVGNSPSERMCWSPSKFFSSNRIQLGKEKGGGT